MFPFMYATQPKLDNFFYFNELVMLRSASINHVKFAAKLLEIDGVLHECESCLWSQIHVV